MWTIFSFGSPMLCKRRLDRDVISSRPSRGHGTVCSIIILQENNFMKTNRRANVLREPSTVLNDFVYCYLCLYSLRIIRFRSYDTKWSDGFETRGICLVKGTSSPASVRMIAWPAGEQLHASAAVTAGVSGRTISAMDPCIARACSTSGISIIIL
jgi:hypothetical protein